MQIDDLKKLSINDDELYFDYDLKKLNWFNIGGKTKVFFKAKSLTGLVNFLKTFKKRGKIFVCLLYTSPSPRDLARSRMPSSA